MSEIDRFRPDDRRGVDTLYRRTHGPDAAEAQSASLGLAASPQPLQPNGTSWHLGRARGTNGCRPVSDATGARVSEGAGGRWRMGHRRAGRPRARQPGARRSAGEGVGSQHRCGPDAGRLGRVTPNARPAALATCPPATVSGQAPDAARRSASPLANVLEPLRLCRLRASRPDRLPVSTAPRRVRADPALRLLIRRVYGNDSPRSSIWLSGVTRRTSTGGTLSLPTSGIPSSRCADRVSCTATRFTATVTNRSGA